MRSERGNLYCVLLIMLAANPPNDVSAYALPASAASSAVPDPDVSGGMIRAVD